MLVTIELPTGSERVTVGDIPALIANALHPEIPEDTPRQITELKKIPTSAENVANWCGANCEAFPVSLTDDDLRSLNSGVWAQLPPLSLPMPEPEWQKYQEAYNENPPAGWTLEPRADNPYIAAMIYRHDATKEWKRVVRDSAMKGHLTPRHPTTFLPQPDAAGEWLLDCFVTTDDLTQFLAKLNIGVTMKATTTLTGTPITKHQLGTKTNILAAVIELATRNAVAPEDNNSVWAAMVKLADSDDKPAPLHGYSSDGIQYLGNSYQQTGIPDIFTKKHLRDRLRRAKTR